MHFKKYIFLLLLIALSFTAESQTPYISWQVELVQEVRTEEDSEVKYDTLKSQKVAVFLEDSSFYVTKGGQRTVYDFRKEKIYFLDIKTKTYDETSLYSEIDYRRKEFLNRLKLKEFLARKGIENKGASLFDLESLFGIVKRPDSLTVDFEKQDGHKFYNYKSSTKSKASFSFSNDSLGSKKETFGKYLLYETQIHPTIIKAAISQDLIPDKISFTFINSGKQYLVNYNLLEVNKKVKPSDFAHSYYLFRHQSKDELLAAINKVYGFVHSNKIKYESDETCILNFEKSLEKKDYINAFLVLFENNLSTGKDYQEQFDLLKKEAKSNKPYQKFILALFEPESKEELRSKIKTLEKYRKKRRIEKSFLIDAFIASYYSGLGDQEKAFDLFHNVIKNNPYITSIYKDLGDLYADQHKMRLAWKCYETAIRLNAYHPLSKELLIRKAYLKKYYSDFFM